MEVFLLGHHVKVPFNEIATFLQIQLMLALSLRSLELHLNELHDLSSIATNLRSQFWCVHNSKYTDTTESVDDGWPQRVYGR